MPREAVSKPSWDKFVTDMEEGIEEMDECGTQGILMSSQKARFGKKVGYWTFFNGISFTFPDLFYFKRPGKQLVTHCLPEDIGEFIGKVCSGDIKLAIDVFRQIIRDEQAKGITLNSEQQLHKVERYLHDMNAILNRNTRREDKKDSRKISLKVPEAFYPKYLPKWAEQGESTCDHPVLQLTKGYCDLCFRVCEAQSTRCNLHVKRDNTETSIRKVQRHFNQAFENLKLRSTYHNRSLFDAENPNYKVLDEDAKSHYRLKPSELFNDKLLHLHRWAFHHPKHLAFVEEIEAIAEEYFPLYELSYLNRNTFEFLKKASVICMSHDHMKLAIQPYEDIENQYKNLFSPVFSVIGDSDGNAVLKNENTTVLTMLARMSLFNLYEAAYKGEELETTHLESF